jgi:hypothetical protein
VHSISGQNFDPKFHFEIFVSKVRNVVLVHNVTIKFIKDIQISPIDVLNKHLHKGSNFYKYYTKIFLVCKNIHGGKNILGYKNIHDDKILS